MANFTWVPVLDAGWVNLEKHMGGDDAVILAARLCYQSASVSEMADKNLIHRLMAAKPEHNTVFEHAVMTFTVKCPIFVARQWMRHRICTFNEKSLRYCLANREYYVPQDHVAGVKEYTKHMEDSFDLYESLIAQGWPKEQARMVLGTSIYTEFVWTVNAWSLMNWLRKRLDSHAQAEHQSYAKAILSIFEQIMPITASAFRKVYIN